MSKIKIPLIAKENSMIKTSLKRIISLMLSMCIVLISLQSMFLTSVASEVDNQIKLINANNITSDGYYVFAIADIASSDQGYGQFAFSCDNTTSKSPLLMQHVKFSSTQPQVNNKIVWKVESFEEGKSIRAISVEGENSYLNINDGNATLGSRQALDLTVASDGAVRLSRTIDSKVWNLRFTNVSGGGWHSFAGGNNNYFKVYSIPKEKITDVLTDRLQEVSADKIVSGSYYTLAIPGISSNNFGVGQFALSSRTNGNTSPLMTKNIKFDKSQKSVSADIAWKIEKFGNGYSFRSCNEKDDNKAYLNVEKGNLSMGARQEISYKINEHGKITLFREIDKVTYYVRFTNSNNIGWQSGTITDTSAFTVYSVPMVMVTSNSVSQIKSDMMEDGKYYVFAIDGIDGMDQAKGQFALSGIATINPTIGMLKHIKFDEAQENLNQNVVWKYEAYGNGFSLKLLSSTSEDCYLNIDLNKSVASAKLGKRQELSIIKNSNGTAYISRKIGSVDYYIRFTGVAGVGWQAATSKSTASFKVFSIPDSVLKAAPKKVNINEIATGGKYIFAISGITSSNYGFGQFALTSERNDYTEQKLLKNLKFDESLGDVPNSIIWNAEKFEKGFAFKAEGVNGENSYLNITMENSKPCVGLGKKQALTLYGNDNGTVIISNVLDGVRHYIRFTNTKGIGWEAGKATSTASFLVYSVLDPQKEAVYEKVRASEVISGKNYVVAMTGILPTGGKRGQYAVVAENTANEEPKLMKYKLFDCSSQEVDYSLVWKIESYEKGWSFKSVGSKGDKYLNIVLNSANQPSVTLGNRQALNITQDSNGLGVISADINGKSYRIRFTGANGQGWQAGTSSSSSTMVFYRVMIDDNELDVEVPREKPLYTFATLTDMHVDYGIENEKNVIREQSQSAMNQIKKEENPDVVFITGDTISTHGSGVWSDETYNKVTSQLVEAFKNTSKDGKVMYVNGNHDYEVGLTQYNSGAYIDEANKNGVGKYTDVLYEDEQRKSNLLAYHYELYGMHFIGLNTPYNGDATIKSPLYTQEEVKWVKDVLAKLNNDEKIVVLGHYPLNNSKGMTPNYGVTNKELQDTFNKYPNLLYIYGHDHGGNFIESDTFERVTAYNADGSIEDSRDVRASGFTSCFGGSLSYYNNRYNPGALSSAQPHVVQALMVYVYEDHIDLEMKNYGQKNGDKKYLLSYTIPIKKFITSEKYSINRTNSSITDVAHKVTINDFVKGLDNQSELKIYGVDGTEIKDYNRTLRSGMMVKRFINGVEVDSLQVLVNKDAVSQNETSNKVPDSKENEMVACVDQNDNKIVVYDLNSKDWNDKSAVIWQWKPTPSLGFTGIPLYTNVTDAKLRYSSFYGGYVVLATASGGFVGIIDYETGERLYSLDTNNESNPHSMELLPNGNIVVASSTGNSLTVYASSQGDGNGYFNRAKFAGAHGVSWDPVRKVVWAIGDYEIAAFEIKGTVEQPIIEKRSDLTCALPPCKGEDGAWGHDIYPVYGTDNMYWASTVDNIYLFDTEKLTASTEFEGHDELVSKDVKSLGTEPFSGTVVRVVPNEKLTPSWNTDRVDLYIPDGAGGYKHEQRIHKNETYYKARVWYDAYSGCIAPAITTDKLDDLQVGEKVNKKLECVGDPEIEWSVVSGDMSSFGLELNAVTGEITGTPLKSGTLSLTVKAKNKYGENIKTYSIVIKDEVPSIIEGLNQTIQGGEALTVKSSAKLKDFVKVLIDEKELENKYYSVLEGPTVVTVAGEYTSTLSEGKHTISIVSLTGTATTEFVVNKASGVRPTEPPKDYPETGDYTNNTIWFAALLISGGIVIGAWLKKRKSALM